MSYRNFLFAGCTAAVVLGVSACASGDVAGNDLQSVSLSFTAGGTAGASVLANDVATSSTPATFASITKVQLVITKMELGRTDNAACVDDDDDDAASSSTPPVANHECEHVSRDPLLVEMPVDGSLKTQLNVPLPAGTYRKLEAKLEPVNTKTTAGAAFAAAHPDFSEISVRVDGTYNGAPFTYKAGIHAAIHMRFDPVLVIDATTKNATVSVDVSKWFVTPSGEAIDPTKAVPGTPGMRAVEANIRASFHAFEDNGKHGKDEGEGHNGKGHDK